MCLRTVAAILLMLVGAGVSAAEIEPIEIRTVGRTECELSLMLDFGREVESCGIRLVSDPDRWVNHSPFSIRVSATEDARGDWLAQVLCSARRMTPAFCAESQFLTWPGTRCRYVRIDVFESGWRGVLATGMYSDWGEWRVRDAFGIPRNSKTEKPDPRFAAIRLFDALPDDYPAWNAHPARAFPDSRLRKDWLLQDFGFEGFWEAARTNGPAYYAACSERRRRRLSRVARTCPKIVYAKHYTIGGDAELSGNAQATDECSCAHPRNWRRGGQLCLLTVREDGTVANEVLLDRPNGCIRDPDVSFDGRRVVFAMRETFAKDEDGLAGKRRPLANMLRPNGDDYHLYTLDLKTRRLVQLTFSDPYPCADFEPCWLSDGRIAFQSTRCVQVIPCHRTQNSNVYVCEADGTGIRRLGYDGGSTLYPQELPDGRLLYTRYEYNDRNARFQQPLFTMNPDGTMQTEYYGNNSWYPTSLIHFRPIPGTHRVIGIVSGHHVAQKGKLAILDNAAGRQGDAGLTFVAGADILERPGKIKSCYDTHPVFVKARAEQSPYVDDFATQHGPQWQYPYPLSEDDWLVAFLPEGSIRGSKCGDGPNFGIYWQNAAGERELLAYDPAIECSQPVPARPRGRVGARRCVAADPSAAYGTFYVQDVYAGEGMRGVARGTVRTLRVCAVENRPMFLYGGSMYAPHDSAYDSFIPYRGDNSGEGVAVRGGTWDVKHVLGEVAVADDGSCAFEVPACNPVYFQLLDAEGRCVQTMRSWATLMPGEFNSCVGCHEDKRDAPPGSAVRPQAVQRLAPAPGQPAHPLLARLDAGGRTSDVGTFLGVNAARSVDPDAPVEGFSFRRLVQPILDRHCVRCHDGGASCAGRPNLTAKVVADPRQPSGGGMEDAHRAFTESYWALTRQGRQTPLLNWYSSTGRSAMLPPYAMGSARSGIMRHLTTAHHGVRATDEERRVFACWIDLGVPFGGSYAEATRWNEEDRRIFDYQQRKRVAFADRERLALLESRPFGQK